MNGVGSFRLGESLLPWSQWLKPVKRAVELKLGSIADVKAASRKEFCGQIYCNRLRCSVLK